MKLKTYLIKNKISYSQFGKKINASRDWVRKIALGIIKTIKTERAFDIQKATNNEVMPIDLINKGE